MSSRYLSLAKFKLQQLIKFQDSKKRRSRTYTSEFVSHCRVRMESLQRNFKRYIEEHESIMKVTLH